MLALALMAASLSSSSCTFRNRPAITQAELVRNEQEIFDAVASGNQEPWKKYFADDSMYFDEKGRSMDKGLSSKTWLLFRQAIPGPSKW